MPAIGTPAATSGKSFDPDVVSRGVANQIDVQKLTASPISPPSGSSYDWRTSYQPLGELKAATPTPTQRIENLAADALTGIGAKPYNAYDLTRRIGRVLGLTPLGVAGSALDLIDAKRRDDFPEAVTAAIGMIPGAKGVARAAANEAGAALGRAVEKAAIEDGVPIAGRTLYHYTDEAGLNGILREQRLNPSLKATSPNDVRYGNGQYLSDISPGTLNPARLSRAFIKVPFQGRKFTHYLEISTGDLNVIRGRPGVYVIPNEVPLDLSGRVVSSGKVPSE